jgi:4-hydroxysphinganine ceramide fatty acyl 2-hydroxylase
MILDWFKHGSNGALVSFIVVMAVLFSIGRVEFNWIAAAIGAAIFLSSEYTTHRFLFHARPQKADWLLRLQHRLHYDHHIDPQKLELLFLPLWFIIPVAVLYFGLYLALTRNAVLSLSLTFGSIVALTFYEWVHYVAHTSFTPVTPFGKYMKKYHLWHHFKNEHYWFGVTNPSTDYLGGSYKEHDSVPRSTTVREIWKEPAL